jgi:hypothetical protein
LRKGSETEVSVDRTTTPLLSGTALPCSSSTVATVATVAATDTADAVGEGAFSGADEGANDNADDDEEAAEDEDDAAVRRRANRLFLLLLLPRRFAIGAVAKMGRT